MLEREDIGVTPRDPYAIAMSKAVQPVGEARDDYDILAGIARVMGVGDAFTEGRSSGEWVRFLWSESQRRAATVGVELPDYDRFVEGRYLRVEPPETRPAMMEAFLADPEGSPLKTPSGKIELYSEVVLSLIHI